jgi:hypothetical protein
MHRHDFQKNVTNDSKILDDVEWSWLLMFSTNPSQTFLVSGETFVNKTFPFIFYPCN